MSFSKNMCHSNNPSWKIVILVTTHKISVIRVISDGGLLE